MVIITRMVKNKKKTVFVGMSGGVDSSVSAAMLQKEGYNVVGVFIRTWHPDFLECNEEEERMEAMPIGSLRYSASSRSMACWLWKTNCLQPTRTLKARLSLSSKSVMVILYTYFTSFFFKNCSVWVVNIIGYSWFEKTSSHLLTVVVTERFVITGSEVRVAVT